MAFTTQPDAVALTDRLFTQLTETGTSDIAIVPGDHDRVEIVTSLMENVTSYQFARGFRGATGTYKGKTIHVLSSGVGGSSFERAIVELHQLGVKTILRVGTTGALVPGIEPGDLIINEASVRLDGTSDHYVRPAYPAAAAYEAVSALVDAARESGLPTHVGIGATTSSFFAGQGRPTFTGWANPTPGVLDEMVRAGVINFEMEAATMFTLARMFGMRAGSVCVVVNNRLEASMGGKPSIPIACKVALEAAIALDGRA